MSKQTQGPNTTLITLGVFIVALILLMLIGYGFLSALFFALVLAVAAAIFFLVVRGRSETTATSPLPTVSPPPTAASSPPARVMSETPPAPEPAASVPEPEPAPVGAPPVSMPSPAPESHEASDVTQSEPQRLAEPREGGPDDLKRIKGIGPKFEETLNGMGFYHLDQIASWTPAEVAWMDDHLEDFRGRVSRDDWVGQARHLVSGGETEFSRRVDEGEVYD